MKQNTFVPTVTISLDEYQQLKRDATPVRIHLEDARSVIIDALCRFGGYPAGQEPGNTVHRMQQYWTYVTRCLLRGETPKAMEDWVLLVQGQSKPSSTTANWWAC